MHGTIFVLTHRDFLEGKDYYCPYEDYEMRDRISGCDCVQKEDDSGFKESIGLLSYVFQLTIPITLMEIDGRNVPVGVLDPANVCKLIQGLEADKRVRIEQVKEEILKCDPDMWKIAYNAYMDSTFYFILADSIYFCNEVDFPSCIEGRHPLYITETFDYYV